MKKIPTHEEIITRMKNKLSGNKPIRELIRGEQGPPGQKGADGVIPTTEKIIAVIESLIPDIVKRLKGDKGDPGESIQGPPGPEGRPGPKGEPGKNGESISRESIVLLFKSLFSDEWNLKKTNEKDIEKTLKELFKSLEKKIDERLSKLEEKKKRTVSGGKAGGMGDPQHETFNITAATTSITTAYPIAAVGNAILKCAYQGQILHKDTHFTVGTDYRTITFVSATQLQFENSTVMELTYIR